MRGGADYLKDKRFRWLALLFVMLFPVPFASWRVSLIFLLAFFVCGVWLLTMKPPSN